MLLYGAACGFVLYLQVNRHFRLHEHLGLPLTYRPYVICTLQFLATFLAGFGLNEAAQRFKSALAALLAFQQSAEELRSLLIGSTDDPKFRFAVQVFITWLVVIMRKTITFFSEDFAHPISELIPAPMRDCVLFCPEVLYSFDRARAELVFDKFLKNARLDKDSRVETMFNKSMSAFNSITELLVVRSPYTKHLLTRIAVCTFLFVIPFIQEDFITVYLLPPVAAMFIAILQLSGELADPWGDDDHDLPLKEVMGVLVRPLWFEGDEEKAAESLRWLNAGLTENRWDHPGEKTPDGYINTIPRNKVEDGSGLEVNFKDFRTLSEIAAGLKIWSSFLDSTTKDMDRSRSHGHRMPDYLHGNKVQRHRTIAF
jgi:hypothetical protein